MIDRVKITLISGKGGDGAIAFRHEKSVEMGGPSGGNGGRGGSIYLVGDEGVNSLSAYRFGKTIRADDGQDGKAKLGYGRNAKDITLPVPLGTVCTTLDGEVLCDITEHGQKVLIAKGGRGGRGNAAFKSPVRRTPKIAENGLPGVTLPVYLELKLIADVGLVGLPNAGKSTFLSANTRADAKVADYAFTTLEPQLGVCILSTDERFVIADIPGLIEGASQGKGLGLAFLRHIERCKVLLHLIDATSTELLSDFEMINEELASYDEELIEKPMVVALNKLDVLSDRSLVDEFIKKYQDSYEIYEISAKEGDGVKKLLKRLYKLSLTKVEDKTTDSEQEVVYKAVKKDDGKIPEYKVVRREDGAFEIIGERVLRTKRLINLSTDEGLDRLLNYLNRIGIDDRLKEAGAVSGNSVILDDFEFEYYE